MKVKYDNKQCVYIIKHEDCEDVTLVNTNDVVEARSFFVEHMKNLFNNAVCEQLKDSFYSLV